MAKTQVMIRLTTDELARLDHLAGRLNNSRAGIATLAVRELLADDAVSRETPPERQAPPPELAPTKLRAGPPPVNPIISPRESPEFQRAKAELAEAIRRDCRHPEGRRMGDYCGACGKEGL